VSFERRLHAVRQLQTVGLTRLHWDVTDGVFAPEGGFGPAEALALAEATGTSAEAHLMVTDARATVDAWTELCDTVVVHAESNNWRAAVRRIESRGVVATVALSPGTPASVAGDLPVLCMSVKPGHGGSPFDHTALNKIAQLSESHPGRPVGVDGGVTRAIAREAFAAGATWVVVGTDLFGDGGAERWADGLSDGG
jgi:ribulose-phosphate 3-epimerase